MIRENSPDICFEKENEYLCVYENETHFFLSALEYKYKYLFFPLLYIVNRFFHMKYSWWPTEGEIKY